MDPDLIQAGFKGGALPLFGNLFNFTQTSLIKTHDFNRQAARTVGQKQHGYHVPGGSILLVRNPFETTLSNYNLGNTHMTHVGHADWDQLTSGE
jgi:hypothetical protein